MADVVFFRKHIKRVNFTEVVDFRVIGNNLFSI